MEDYQKDWNELFQRFKGMFWGLVVGDCLGSPIQFTEKDSHPHITEMVPCPCFNTPKGYWTDDSSMAFCVAESLVRLGKYDLADLANNFVRWYKEGVWSSCTYAFDVGHATVEAVYQIQRGSLCNGRESSQGNGSIMRFAPSYIWNYGNADNKVLHEISDLTHCSRKIRETVDLMAQICDEHLQGKRTTAESIYQTRDEVNNSGWAVSTLQAALWAFKTTSTFEDGMIAAVNLGGDSDSIGAVYGQIAGAYYGYDAIPERWLTAIKDRKKVNDLIEALIRLKEKCAKNNHSTPDGARSEETVQPEAQEQESTMTALDLLQGLHILDVDGQPYPYQDPKEFLSQEEVIIAFRGGRNSNKTGDGHFMESICGYYESVGKRVAKFRFCDWKNRAKAFFDSLYNAGMRDFHFIGHSLGGMAADEFTCWIINERPGCRIHLTAFDAVSGKGYSPKFKTPKEVRSIYYPTNPGNMMARLGGRYEKPEDAIVYQGGHNHGFLEEFIKRQSAKTEP